MKRDTRARLLEVGSEIAHHKGYNSTGIQEVLKAAGVPRGSFHFYFKNLVGMQRNRREALKTAGVPE